jgi:hypothetical protein
VPNYTVVCTFPQADYTLEDAQVSIPKPTVSCGAGVAVGAYSLGYTSSGGYRELWASSNSELMYSVGEKIIQYTSIVCDGNTIAPNSPARCGSVNIVAASSTLSCGDVPSSGTAGSPITPPTVKCGATDVTTGITWAPTGLNWATPAIGTYTGIKATATCGGTSQTANCSGDLVVSEASASTLECTGLAATGTAGTAVPWPTVKCNGESIGNTSITLAAVSGTFNRGNPAVGTYTVTAKVSAGACATLPAVTCGPITINPVKPTCTLPATTGTVGTAITVPANTVQCGGANVPANGYTWSSNPAGISWSSPALGEWTNIKATVSADGNCKGGVADCAGKFTVEAAVTPKVLTCTSVPTGSIEGKAITARPTISCNGTAVTSGITWASAPAIDWNNPATGNYTLTASASSGTCAGETITCSPALAVASALTCGTVPATGTAGGSATPPTVTCGTTPVTSGIAWKNGNTVFSWDPLPAAGEYSSINAGVSSGNCSGQTATCAGTLTVSPANACKYQGEWCNNVEVTYSTIVPITQSGNAAKCYFVSSISSVVQVYNDNQSKAPMINGVNITCGSTCSSLSLPEKADGGYYVYVGPYGMFNATTTGGAKPSNCQ